MKPQIVGQRQKVMRLKEFGLQSLLRLHPLGR